LAVAIAVSFSACGGKKRQQRSGDAAPVEPISAPNLPDGGTSKGIKADEVEPNDGDDVAMVLPLGATIHGRIEPETDVDYYRIEVTAAGALSADLSAVDGVDLTLELLDSSGTSLAKSDRGTVKTREGFSNFGVTPGRYSVVVRGKKVVAKGKPKKPPVAAPVLPYDLTVNVSAPPANAEREPDDDRGTANDLIVGVAASGYIGWTNDVDVWKLSVETLSAKNSVDIEIGAVEGVAFTLEVADGVGQVLVTRKAPKGAGLVMRGLVPVLPAGAPPFHYLTIKGSPSNPESPYSLRVLAKPTENDAEAEPNDTPEKAMPVPADRTVVHAQWSPGDVDCFAIAPDPAARTITVVIETPQEADLSAELIVDGKTVSKSELKGKGTHEKVTGPVPANGHAVVRVRGADGGGEGQYDVKVSEGPAAP
jgi:hypothetical protein